MRAFVFTILFAVISVAGCSSRPPLFTLNEPSFQLKGTSLAVVSGLKKHNSLFAAECMADALRHNSRFHVLPQERVVKKIRSYPFNIRGPYRSAYFDIDVDYSMTDRERVRELHRILGTDYLFIIWAPTGSIIEEKVVVVDMIAQLFEGPESREVGHGLFWSQAGRSIGWCASPATKAEVDISIRQICDAVAKDIASQTSMEKITRAPSKEF